MLRTKKQTALSISLNKNMIKILSVFFLLLSLYSCSIADSQPNGKNTENIIIPSDSTLPKSNKLEELEIDPNLSEKDKERVKEIISKKYLMGQFDPASDNRFMLIPAKKLVNSDQAIYIRKEAMEAFNNMYAAAEKEGIKLKIMSATRPFSVQKAIWERKWLGKQMVNGQFIPDSIKGKARALRILEWNSMPSTSRHHWGSDIDINNVNPEYWEQPLGKKEYEWLVKHAHEYGFCQPYSKMGPERPEGYQEEKWHWSYLPISRELVKRYQQEIIDADISGFLGAETAKDIGVVKIYVLGINPACQ